VISIPTSPLAHYVGDALAWLSASATAYLQHRRWPSGADRLSRITDTGYFVMLGTGALLGAWLFGSLNSARSAVASPSHSIAGALAGGIAAVEFWKWRHGIRLSTGGAFVLPICAGIIIGRLGCLFSGLADYTYGTATWVPWAMDIGDGVGRHPVQLYESLSMAVFAGILVRARSAGRNWAVGHAFHAMIIVYAAQRFAWEFLKPYPTILGPLNVFHFLMMGLILYGVTWWGRSEEFRGVPAGD